MSDDPDACPKPRLEEACKALCSKYVVAYQVRATSRRRLERERERACFFEGKGPLKTKMRKGGGRLLIEIEMAASEGDVFVPNSRRRRCAPFSLCPVGAAEFETLSRVAWRKSRIDSGPSAFL